MEANEHERKADHCFGGVLQSRAFPKQERKGDCHQWKRKITDVDATNGEGDNPSGNGGSDISTEDDSNGFFESQHPCINKTNGHYRGC